jgi:hypothetical protein
MGLGAKPKLRKYLGGMRKGDGSGAFWCLVIISFYHGERRGLRGEHYLNIRTETLNNPAKHKGLGYFFVGSYSSKKAT